MKPDPRHSAEGIDVILRFHDPARMEELERAVFSLLGQNYRPLRILLALQRFDAAQREAVAHALAPLLAWAAAVRPGAELELLDYQGAVPADARSELINLGIAAATGRYLAFLDYDDLLAPSAYRRLTGQLRSGQAAIAFGRTPLLDVDMGGAFPHVIGRRHPFDGRDLTDLFAANFCPLHSYVVDRLRVPPGVLRFESMLAIEEDYDFLLRLCAAAPADFTLIGVDVGLYVQKNDGSNSWPAEGSGPSSPRGEAEALARQFIELRRRMTVIAPEVQARLALAEPRPGLTIRAWLDEAKPPG